MWRPCGRVTFFCANVLIRLRTTSMPLRVATDGSAPPPPHLARRPTARQTRSAPALPPCSCPPATPWPVPGCSSSFRFQETPARPARVSAPSTSSPRDPAHGDDDVRAVAVPRDNLQALDSLHVAHNVGERSRSVLGRQEGSAGVAARGSWNGDTPSPPCFGVSLSAPVSWCVGRAGVPRQLVRDWLLYSVAVRRTLPLGSTEHGCWIYFCAAGS